MDMLMELTKRGETQKEFAEKADVETITIVTMVIIMAKDTIVMIDMTEKDITDRIIQISENSVRIGDTSIAKGFGDRNEKIEKVIHVGGFFLY